MAFLPITTQDSAFAGFPRSFEHLDKRVCRQHVEFAMRFFLNLTELVDLPSMKIITSDEPSLLEHLHDGFIKNGFNSKSVRSKASGDLKFLIIRF